MNKDLRQDNNEPVTLAQAACPHEYNFLLAALYGQKIQCSKCGKKLK